MSFPNNHTYKVANGISTISCIDRRAANRKAYACAAGTPYTTDDQILEVVTEVDAERLRETMPHLMGLTWDDELWVCTIIAEKVAFQMRGRFGELEHPIKKELWYTLQRGIYDQDLLEHGATVPRAVRHATASTSLLWSLVWEGESRVERLEREVKEAKADVLRLSAEGLQMKETLAAFQQGTNEALEAMVANHQELIAGLKVRDNNIKGALARRDEKTEELENVVAVLTAQVESLQDKTCNCKEGPKLVGQGTADVPFELEYADEVVLPSPNPSSYATPPIENAVPVPTPGPASTLAASDKENCGRCVLQPVHQLVKIEDEVMEVDRAEDAPRVAESSRMVTSLVEVESEIQLRHQRRLTIQDPTQGSDEEDGGSLADYVDSTVEQSPGDGDVGPGVQQFGDIWEADRIRSVKHSKHKKCGKEVTDVPGSDSNSTPAAEQAILGGPSSIAAPRLFLPSRLEPHEVRAPVRPAPSNTQGVPTLSAFSFQISNRSSQPSHRGVFEDDHSLRQIPASHRSDERVVGFTPPPTTQALAQRNPFHRGVFEDDRSLHQIPASQRSDERVIGFTPPLTTQPPAQPTIAPLAPSVSLPNLSSRQHSGNPISGNYLSSENLQRYAEIQLESAKEWEGTVFCPLEIKDFIERSNRCFAWSRQ
ncbi:hypothetical protein BJ322DRAFT_1020307 [Thelephora terrestris]|uniref:Uncharacterized protein n=1 Tax=Thelephora terrestris TaxID=56493 RepID=A0A9P6HHC5_9AGAM|nr:hypothetical protein BJ322DRAFT_1020307 [Thelephora terrestris]